MSANTRAAKDVNARGSRIVATYDYCDEAGALLYQVVRFDPKDFKQRQPAGSGKWKWGLEGVRRRVLYRLPELLRSPKERPVFIAEGEKDADRLRSLGLLATTNAGGAGKWRPEYNEPLRDRPVYILPDNDDAGRKHALAVAGALAGVVASCKIVTLPSLPAKGDVSDWLAAGGDKEKLLDIAQRGDAWEGEVSGRNGQARPPEVGVLLSAVKPEQVTWLWPGRIPFGKLTILDGDPGLGKSALTIDLAARVSRGSAMPLEAHGVARRPAGVVLLSAEDGVADTIVPRLLAAGGDPARVLSVTTIIEGENERGVTLPDDLPWLRAAILRVKAGLVVVDPVMAFFGSRTDTHRDQDCRRALHPIARLAEETGAAVLVVRHLNKGAGGNPLYRGGGSIGFIGAARSALLVARDPDDPNRRVVASMKSNLAALPASLAFALEATGDTVRVGWIGECAYAAASLLGVAASDKDRSALEEAKDWLLAELTDKDGAPQERHAAELLSDAHKVGISKETLRDAKLALKLTKRRIGFGHGGAWYWSLPAGS